MQFGWMFVQNKDCYFQIYLGSPEKALALHKHRISRFHTSHKMASQEKNAVHKGTFIIIIILPWRKE